VDRVVGTLVAGIGADPARDTLPVPFGEAVGWGTGLGDIGPAADKAALHTAFSLVGEDLVTVRAVLEGTGAEAGRGSGSDPFVGSDIHELRTALEPEAGRHSEGCKPSPMAFRWSVPLLQQWPLSLPTCWDIVKARFQR